MVKQECEAKANTMLDYYADLQTLWDAVTDLNRGKGDNYDTAGAVETFIKATDLRTFGSDHHSELITHLEDIKTALKGDNITVAMQEMGKIFTEMPKIVTDVISGCECGEFTVNLGDLYDVVEAQVIQGKDIDEVKKIVAGTWDDTTDEQIESAFRDAKTIRTHMETEHPEITVPHGTSGGDWKEKYGLNCWGFSIKDLTMDETGKSSIDDPHYWDECEFTCPTCNGTGEVYELGGKSVCGNCYGAKKVKEFPAMQSWIQDEMNK